MDRAYQVGRDAISDLRAHDSERADELAVRFDELMRDFRSAP